MAETRLLWRDKRVDRTTANAVEFRLWNAEEVKAVLHTVSFALNDTHRQATITQFLPSDLPREFEALVAVKHLSTPTEIRGIQLQLITPPRRPFPTEVVEPKGVVYTKRWGVELLLDLTGYCSRKNLVDALAVEPTAGDGALVLAMEFKSQAGQSIGNNVTNRSEEAVGSAKDISTAFREGRFGQSPPPFLGYLFLLEDRDNVKTPVANKEPYFPVDPAFRGETRSKDPMAHRSYKGVSFGPSYQPFTLTSAASRCTRTRGASSVILRERLCTRDPHLQSRSRNTRHFVIW